ncbi:MAG: peptidase M20 [Phenylobacterium sp. RIFCSPHIGHO2_01_FULL_69_31]|jgi:Zn-dependent M28 family amino/carboxypeptidase|uniref:M28 family metallopeptidase n=1 Tax=Phenylobacterium sp. RIFCSPHIGHO2_01_FULL_69_31 TaxID=1801944 RepID=UPI0008CD6A14|nr:M28 family metallopeptidase [Phenylobacterium sp. RIFCSPHIGHO2_01_FULL_69_31]OHB30577.1 MAG: peptidase M20 [Phenylobacterium sp. RIFCSPHIGHO2_01_FULL_69_31]
MQKFLLSAAVSVLVATSAMAAPSAVDVGRIMTDTQVLSSDAYEGRAPASEGEKKTVAYLIEQMKAAGLQPAGDRQTDGSRAWTQDVPLVRSATKGPVAVSVTMGGETRTWTQGEEIAIRATMIGNRLTVKDAPVVFVGYGVSAPERKWDDFKGMDLKGKVALVLVNDPDFETGEGDFGGKAMTYYGRWTYKFEEAARRGAIGFLVIHETAPASYGWATVKNSNTNEIFDVIRKDPSTDHAPLEGWVQRDQAVAMLAAAGLDFEALKKQAQTRAFKPVELKGVTFSTDYAVDAQKVVSKNVVGALPGSKHPEERIFYTAHWDHLGVGQPDAKGDTIYNGALDNASGTAMLLELGRAFAKGPKPQRTVVFMAVTAEEKGLLGSEYYASSPLYPLATTVGVINMDGVGPSGLAKDFTTSGNAPLTLQDELIAVGKTHDRYYSPDPRPEAGSFFRSDHFPFAKVGVPAISFGGGQDLVQGGKAAGMARRTAYTANQYHQPADEFDPNWDPKGFEADGTLLFDLGQKLANSRVWPEWKVGAEFKAERDKTKAQRK